MGLRQKFSAAFKAFRRGDYSVEEKLNLISLADPTRLFATTNDRYNPSELVTVKGLGVFDKMMKDDQVKAAMKFKKSVVLAPGWEIIAPEDKPVDWDVKEFVEDQLKNINGSFEKVLREILTALEYGYSVSEKVHVEQGERVGLRAIKTRRPHEMAFVQDKAGNIVGLKQWENELPIEKFICFAFESRFDNPYGTSDLEAAYRGWWHKENAYKWLSMLLERYGIPPVFAKYDQGLFSTKDVDDLYNVVTSLQSASAGVLPAGQEMKGLDFWTPEIAQRAAETFKNAIEMYNRDMSRGLLMPGLLGLTSDESQGSLARSQTHFDSFMLIVEEIQNELAINVVQEQIIKPLVDLNFNTDAYPIFKFLPLTNDARLEVLQEWRNMVEKGIVKQSPDDEAYIRKVVEFPERDTSEDEPLEPEDDEEPELITEFALSRQKNKYEKKVDFQEIQQELDSNDSQMIKEIKSIIKDMQSDVIKQIVNNFEGAPEDIKKIKIKSSSQNKITKTLQTGINKTLNDGRNSVKSELPKQFQQAKSPLVVPSAAVKWLRAKAQGMSDSINGQLASGVNSILVQALKTGEPINATITKIQDFFEPYVGDETVLKDGEEIPAYRVEAVVRTANTEAYNQGRLIQIRDPDVADFVSGVQYSAIIDSRTTEVCRHLDEKIFKPGDSNLDTLIPPNHHNCRSLLVPVMIDEQPEQSDFITPSQVGKGVELANKRFV